MSTTTEHPGPRLRRFREGLGLSLREAARQLHVAHPALKDWEEEKQTPTSPYRDAIEVWTNGDIKASDWPLSGRERDIVENAAKVGPAIGASESGEHGAVNVGSTGTDR